MNLDVYTHDTLEAEDFVSWNVVIYRLVSTISFTFPDGYVNEMPLFTYADIEETELADDLRNDFFCPACEDRHGSQMVLDTVTLNGTKYEVLYCAEAQKSYGFIGVWV